MESFVNTCVSTASCGISRVMLASEEDAMSVNPLRDNSCSPSKTINSSSIISKPRKEARFVRPMGYAENFMTTASFFGNMSTVYALWFDSRRPISIDAIKQTAHVVFRKFTHLRLCIRLRRLRLWWHEMEHDKLDVEEIQTNDIQETFENLLKRAYNLQEGPLWFVRFLTLPVNECLVRDDNYNVKHKYVCIFGFHHNATDGSTNMKFCDVFLKVLNSILMKRETDTESVGYFAPPFHDRLSDEMSSFYYQNTVFLRRFYTSVLKSSSAVRNLSKYYPLPCHEDMKLHVICKELDKITTERLLKRCRMEKVTLNSAFTAAANIGMFQVIRLRNAAMHSTNIVSQQTINMRRYWPSDVRKNSFGCHICLIDVSCPVTNHDIDNFWEYARNVHEILKEDLNEVKRPLRLQPLGPRLVLAVLINHIACKLKLPTANDSHFCITNMGDVSSTFSGDGEEVEVTRILRAVTCQNMQSLCQHTLQTFKGKFYYSLDYYPQKIEAATARIYSSYLMDCLVHAIHSPN